MERDVIFIIKKVRDYGDDVPGPHVDHEIQIQFEVFQPMNTAALKVSFVEHRDWKHSILLYDNRVMLEGQDAVLAGACLATSNPVACDLAHNLFWRKVVVPSMEAQDQHWLCKWAPWYWHYVSKIFFEGREAECREVHDS